MRGVRVSRQENGETVFENRDQASKPGGPGKAPARLLKTFSLKGRAKLETEGREKGSKGWHSGERQKSLAGQIVEALAGHKSKTHKATRPWKRGRALSEFFLLPGQRFWFQRRCQMAKFCRGCEDSDGMPHKHLSAKEAKASVKKWEKLADESRRLEAQVLKKLGLKNPPDMDHKKYEEYRAEWDRVAWGGTLGLAKRWDAKKAVAR